MPSFEVVPYSIDELRKTLTVYSQASEEAVERSLHYFYARTYFSYIRARTMLVESSYVDRDYLEDYAGYYVLCFKKYERHCTRIHFFRNEFSKNDFQKLIAGKPGRLSLQDLQNKENYLGFTVIKNLPKTIIGRTCLKTYPKQSHSHGTRCYPITRDYEANLFGIQLKVNSIAFQEQDSVVAACATSALWSAFQGTGKLFQHQIPSPFEITRAATRQIPLETRTFPSSGLSIPQMADAVRHVGLEPYLISPENEFLFKASIYAYLKGKIPVLFGIFLHDLSDESLYTFDQENTSEIQGHAVTITGYHLSSGLPVSYPESPFSCRAFRIDKIYVHDDQIGPFARMGIEIGSIDEIPWTLSTSWMGGDGRIGNVKAVPWILMVPLYHKIRISFYSVYSVVSSFQERVIEPLRATRVISHADDMEWDIYLTTVNRFKTEIFASDKYSEKTRLDVLLRSMPRFLWRATARCREDVVLDLVFDATDIEQDQFLCHAIITNRELQETLGSISADPSLLGISKTDPEWKILWWFSGW